MALWNDLRKFLELYLSLWVWATYFTVFSITLHWLTGKVALPAALNKWSYRCSNLLCHWAAKTDTQATKASRITDHSFRLSGIACLIVTAARKRERAKRNLLALSSTEESRKKVRWIGAPGSHAVKLFPLQATGLKSLPQIELSYRKVWGLFCLLQPSGSLKLKQNHHLLTSQTDTQPCPAEGQIYRTTLCTLASP